MKRKYGGGEVRAEGAAKAKAPSALRGCCLSGAEKPIKSQIDQLEKNWPNEVRQEGRSYVKEFERFLNSGSSCWIILRKGMTVQYTFQKMYSKTLFKNICL